MKHYQKKPSKYTPEQLNKLFPYSLPEDIGNAVSHCFGAIISLGLLLSLAWIAGKYGDWVDCAAFIFYGMTILLMFVISTVYHSMINHTARNVLKRLDHISIFILILGSYTPYVFSLLKTSRAYFTYKLLCFLTVVGIIFKAIYAGRYKKIGTLVYILMGWAVVMLMPEIVGRLPYMGIVFMLSSGVIYTLGAVFYAFSKFKYSHTVWHIFVIFAVLSMYLSIGFYILQSRPIST